jgi:hypothetical protein
VDVAGGAPGISISADSSSLSLGMQWNAIAHGALTVAVRGPDGASSLPGARVRLSLQPTTTPVAVTTATALGSPSVMLPAFGSFNAERLSDDAGNASFAALPVGTYDVTIVPPPGSPTGAAITALSVALTAAGVTRAVTLAQKVSLIGTLTPLPGVGGASITAVDQSPDAIGVAVSATADDTGHFRLSVDPARSYQLIVQPRSGQSLGRTVLASQTFPAGAASIITLDLPPGLVVTGRVTSRGTDIGGAFVQAFCTASTATCVDPTVSLGEATSAADGTFSVVLPDPNAGP